MEAFAPFLYNALRNHAEHQVCSIAVGTVGDICRALNKKILPYCPTIMGLLLQNLQSPQLHRQVKPSILACFGDIALAINGDYISFLDISMQVLIQASQTQAARDDHEMFEYIETLQENILAAYTGIIQGLKSSHDDSLAKNHHHHSASVQAMFPYIPLVMEFLHRVAEDANRSDIMTRAATGLLGDLADAFGNSIVEYLRYPWVDDLLRQCKASLQKPTKEVGKWARTVIKNVTS
jgi:importin subunit beta-1